MTLPYERANAVIMTKDFLLELIDPRATPRVPLSIRKKALYLLRHYPTTADLELVEFGWNHTFIQCPFNVSKPL
jgi:hypothetical protein